MTKDASIWRMLGALADRLDSHRFQVIDHWDADLFAIGIARADEPAQLVYVSTYRQTPAHYSFECEQQEGDQPSEVGERAEEATFDEFVDVVRRHLSLG